jgi:hypothetical protein
MRIVEYNKLQLRVVYTGKVVCIMGTCDMNMSSLEGTLQIT